MLPFEEVIAELLLAEAQRIMAGGPALPPPPPAPATAPAAPPLAGLAEAQAALASVHEEAAALGVQLLPLRSPADILKLAEVELLYPAALPHRSRKMLAELRDRHVHIATEFELMQLVERLEQLDEWAAALQRLHVPSEKRCFLVPSVAACVLCARDGRHSALCDARDGRPTHPLVFSTRGPLEAELCCKVCSDSDCRAVHTMSFVHGGKRLPPGKQLWYEDATSQPWFQSTHGTIFERKLLLQLNVQMLHSHSGWDTFGREYEMLHGVHVTERFRRALGHAWLARSLLSWSADMLAPLDVVDLCSDEGLDATLLEQQPKLLAFFIFTWGVEHNQHCRSPETCVAYILDGHFKCRRIVRAWSRARVVRVKGLKSDLVLGCMGTPMVGSRFCKEHTQRTAVRSKDPELSEVDFDVPEGLPAELFQPWLPGQAAAAAPDAAAPDPTAVASTVAPTSPPATATAASDVAVSAGVDVPPAAAEVGASPAVPAVAPAVAVPSAAAPSSAARPSVRRSSRLSERVAKAAAAAKELEQARESGGGSGGREGSASDPEEEEDEAPVAATWEVVRLKQHQRLTQKFVNARGSAHVGCLAAGMRAFQVEWLPPWQPTWECECDIGTVAVEEYDNGRAAAREAAAEERRSAAKRAAVAGAEQVEAASAAPTAPAVDVRAERVAKRARTMRMLQADSATSAGGVLAGTEQSTGDFAQLAEEKAQMAKEIGCANLKEDQYRKGKTREHHVPKAMSAGVLALVSSCGLFLSVKEMLGSESLQQVHLFLHEVFFRDGLPVPKVLCYDDACHLLMFLRNRAGHAEKYGYSKFAWWLLTHKLVKICCDRFHFPNHKNNPFCKRWVDPAKCEELGARTNTMAAEEAFAWLARSKHIFKKMNQARFLFVMLRLLELRNRWLEQEKHT